MSQVQEQEEPENTYFKPLALFFCLSDSRHQTMMFRNGLAFIHLYPGFGSLGARVGFEVVAEN